MDFSAMTLEELNLLRLELLDEIADRERVASGAEAVHDVSAAYAAAGGDPHDLCETCLGKPDPVEPPVAP